MRILQLSTHSTLVPRHGGQFRSHHIGRCLEQAGFEVSRIAVCWRTEHDLDDAREPIIDVRQTNYWSSATYRAARAWGTYFADYYAAFAVAEAPHLKSELYAKIAAARPDAILLEHPWTWLLVKTLPGVTSGVVRVVYSSQNVEAPLKRRMAREAGLTVPEDLLVAVEEFERDLVTSAWATVACTPTDAEIFLSWGAGRLVVANNGAIRKRRDNLLGALPPPLSPETRFALFVGSSHLPNVSGFFKFLAPALLRLRPHERIVITGSMCDSINARIAASPLRHYQDRRLVSLGFVDELVLDALLANASAILLPIEYGGGSNVKTAEALAAGRPVIATKSAFRGFAEYEALSSVTLAETPEAFESAIRDALSKPPSDLKYIEPPRELLWEATLDSLIALLRSIPAGR